MKTKVSKMMVVAVGLVFLTSSVQAEILYNVIDLGLGGARCINSSNQVVGYTYDSQGNTKACIFDTTGHGNNTIIGSPGEISSAANWINNDGQIVGTVQDSSTSHATLFDSMGSGNNTYLGNGYAVCINNNSQIVGWLGTDSSHTAAIFDNTGGGNNTTLGAGFSAALCVNDNGQIVGYDNSNATVFDATGGKHNTTVGTGFAHYVNNSEQLGGGSSGYPILFDNTGHGNNISLASVFGIAEHGNNNGLIVGYVDNSGWKATIFDPTGNKNNIILNTVIDSSLGWNLQVAWRSNDNGYIVGYGTRSGQTHAFLLQPIPEPVTIFIFAAGSLLLRRRRT